MAREKNVPCRRCYTSRGRHFSGWQCAKKCASLSLDLCVTPFSFQPPNAQTRAQAHTQTQQQKQESDMSATVTSSLAHGRRRRPQVSPWLHLSPLKPCSVPSHPCVLHPASRSGLRTARNRNGRTQTDTLELATLPVGEWTRRCSCSSLAFIPVVLVVGLEAAEAAAATTATTTTTTRAQRTLCSRQ